MFRKNKARNKDYIRYISYQEITEVKESDGLILQQNKQGLLKTLKVGMIETADGCYLLNKEGLAIIKQFEKNQPGKTIELPLIFSFPVKPKHMALGASYDEGDKKGSALLLAMTSKQVNVAQVNLKKAGFESLDLGTEIHNQQTYLMLDRDIIDTFDYQTMKKFAEVINGIYAMTCMKVYSLDNKPEIINGKVTTKAKQAKTAGVIGPQRTAMSEFFFSKNKDIDSYIAEIEKIRNAP